MSNTNVRVCQSESFYFVTHAILYYIYSLFIDIYSKQCSYGVSRYLSTVELGYDTCPSHNNSVYFIINNFRILVPRCYLYSQITVGKYYTS